MRPAGVMISYGVQSLVSVLTLVDLVRRKPHASHIEAVDVVEPQHGSGDLPVEAGRHKHDPYLAAENGLFTTDVLEELSETRPSLLDRIGFHLRQVELIVLDEVVEGHDRHHRRVPQCLQFQMTTVGGAFQLHDHDVAGSVHTEQVDPAAGVSEGPELLGDHQHVVDDHVQLRSEQPL